MLQLHEKYLNCIEGKEYVRKNLKFRSTLKWAKLLLRLLVRAFYKFHFEKTRGFLICHFTRSNFGENKLWPLDILRDCVTPLGNFKFKSQDLRNSRWFFLDHPWKFHFFFNWPLEFSDALCSIPLEIPCPQPPPLPHCLWILSGIVYVS